MLRSRKKAYQRIVFKSRHNEASRPTIPTDSGPHWVPMTKHNTTNQLLIDMS